MWTSMEINLACVLIIFTALNLIGFFVACCLGCYLSDEEQEQVLPTSGNKNFLHFLKEIYRSFHFFKVKSTNLFPPQKRTTAKRALL